MELWVRSQDKEVLQKITSLFVNDDGYIFSYDYINSNEVFLGKYKTKERALEVLDEIHSILMPQVKAIYNNKIEEVKLQDITSNIIVQPIIKDIQIQQANSYVYEMPKE